jgi:hypothetical protein
MAFSRSLCRRRIAQRYFMRCGDGDGDGVDAAGTCAGLIAVRE